MKLSLAQKLVLVIEVVVVVFTVFGGIATYLVLQKSLVDRARNQLASIAVLKENAIKKKIEHAKTEIQYFVETSHRQAKLQQVLLEGSGETGYILETFQELIQDGNTYRDLLLLDAQGVVVVSSNPSDEGKIKSTESYFVQAQEEIYVESFYYDVTLGETAMAIGMPVKIEGKTIGVMVGRLGIEEISNLMFERSGLGETGETFIVNSSNVVVTELRKEPGLMLKKTLFLPQVDKCLSGESNFDGGVDYHGDQVFGYWQWFPEIKSCLVTKMNIAEALAPIAQATVILMGVVILIGVSVGVFGYMMGKLMMRPLAKLREEAQKIREGNFEVSMIMETKDEIGEVALAFNEMGGELKEIYAGLEDKVKEKTLELSKKLVEMNTLNTTLSENKSAMVNLLEDAKSLEEQLKTEKEGVEKKVEDRTRQLSEERAELLAVINAIARGLMVVDKNWKVILENETLGKIMGKNGACGQLTDLVEYLSSAFDLNKIVAETFSKQNDVMAGPELIGNRYLHLHVVPVMHAEVVGAVAIFVKDVTEATVMQRSRDEFFSIASHELRTPLTAIRGNAEMILDNYKDKIPDKDVTEMLGDIHEGSIRLIAIVNDFLNVSRLEMGKMEFKLVATDLKVVAQEVIKEFEVTGSQQKVKIELLERAEQVPPAKADSDRVKQVMINLIGNGLKFTTAGTITLDVVNDGDMVKVSVSDSGSGIPKEQQGLLFHKFQQAGSSLYTRDTSKGTGLGLYISKLMIEGMEGKIWLDKSEVGKGTTFAFSLPIFDAQQVSIDKNA